MTDIKYTLDPKGDTILVLKNANAPFAPWFNETNHLLDAHQPRVLVPIKRASMKNSSDDNPAGETFLIEDIPGNDAPLQITRTSGEDALSDWSEANDAVDAHTPASEDATYVEHEEEEPELRMLVSSKHLILASTYFEKMFDGSWEETSQDQDSGSPYLIGASDWDEEALLILMNIIHGRSRSVPRAVDLELLAKISVLVDYYGCHESVELYLEKWLRNLPTATCTVYDRNLMMRLAVACVFLDEPTIQTLASVIERETCGPVNTLDLPIPPKLVSECFHHCIRHISANIICRLDGQEKTKCCKTRLQKNIRYFGCTFRQRTAMQLRMRLNAPRCSYQAFEQA